MSYFPLIILVIGTMSGTVLNRTTRVLFGFGIINILPFASFIRILTGLAWVSAWVWAFASLVWWHVLIVIVAQIIPSEIVPKQKGPMLGLFTIISLVCGVICVGCISYLWVYHWPF